jgi:hypothetical protein
MLYLFPKGVFSNIIKHFSHFRIILILTVILMKKCFIVPMIAFSIGQLDAFSYFAIIDNSSLSYFVHVSFCLY